MKEAPEQRRVDLRSLLVCPRCRAALDWSRPDALACTSCGARYAVVDGIPVMVSEAQAGHDEALEHKRGQRTYFDREDEEEFEISRPHGAPRLYRWLLSEKFRKSVSGLEGAVHGGSVLAVCAGSGMDGEFLERSGAQVIVSDISLGAVRRALERRKRFGLRYAAVVADVEHLPFADRSLDVVYVHDGLHHLSAPVRGLAEMSRVARRAVSVTEPAAAFVTAIAVRVGLSLEIEESGNRVERLRRDDVTHELTNSGFAVVGAERYLMYYRHHPGAAERALSGPPFFSVVRAILWSLNLVLGPFGNKLSVRAVRPDDRD